MQRLHDDFPLFRLTVVPTLRYALTMIETQTETRQPDGSAGPAGEM